MTPRFHVVFYWSEAQGPLELLAGVLTGQRGQLHSEPTENVVPRNGSDLVLGIHWNQRPSGQCITGGVIGVAGHAFRAIVAAVEGVDCPYGSYRGYYEWAKRYVERIRAVYILSGDLVPRDLYAAAKTRLRERIDIDCFEIDEYAFKLGANLAASDQAPVDRRHVQRRYHSVSAFLDAGNPVQARVEAAALATELTEIGEFKAASVVTESSDLRWALNSAVVVGAVFGILPTAASKIETSLDGLRIHLVDDDPLSEELAAAFEAHNCRIDQDRTAEAACERIGADPHEVLVCDVYLDDTGSTLAAESVLSRAGSDVRILRIVWSYAASEIAAELADLRITGPDVKTVSGVTRLCSIIADLRRQRLAGR